MLQDEVCKQQFKSTYPEFCSQQGMDDPEQPFDHKYYDDWRTAWTAGLEAVEATKTKQATIKQDKFEARFPQYITQCLFSGIQYKHLELWKKWSLAFDSGTASAEAVKLGTQIQLI